MEKLEISPKVAHIACRIWEASQRGEIDNVGIFCEDCKDQEAMDKFRVWWNAQTDFQ